MSEPGIWMILNINFHMGVSKNNGTPKSSILIGFSIINHPFWGTPIFGNTHIHQVEIDFRELEYPCQTPVAVEELKVKGYEFCRPMEIPWRLHI